MMDWIAERVPVFLVWSLLGIMLWAIIIGVLTTVALVLL